MIIDGLKCAIEISICVFVFKDSKNGKACARNQKNWDMDSGERCFLNRLWDRPTGCRWISRHRMGGKILGQDSVEGFDLWVCKGGISPHKADGPAEARIGKADQAWRGNAQRLGDANRNQTVGQAATGNLGNTGKGLEGLFDVDGKPPRFGEGAKTFVQVMPGGRMGFYGENGKGALCC